MKTSAKSMDAALLTPRQLFDRLGRYVIGQERAKRAVAVAAYNHLKRCSLRRRGQHTRMRKSNILLVGPTGSGKTHLARTLATVLSVPFTVADATEYTEAGYYGKDVEMMIGDLLLKADQSVEEAQRGIVFLDEIDKIARRSQGAHTGAGSRDIGGEGVQQALLKLLEGREVYVPSSGPQHWARQDFTLVDTTDILFVCAGTFSDLFAYRGQRAVGFHASRSVARDRISLRELRDYGMLSELLGRLPIVTELEELQPTELVEIITKPPDALLKEYRELLSLDGVELTAHEAALRAIAGFAYDRGLGARGLRALFEELMAETLFTAPERRGEKVVLDEKFVSQRLEGVHPEALRLE